MRARTRMHAANLLAAAALAASIAAAVRDVPPPVNLTPIIAIFTIPLSNAEVPCLTHAAARGLNASDPTISCFGAFYPEWLMSSGARVAILPYNADPATMDAILDSVNGVLFTGGGLENLTFETPYMTGAAYVLQRAQQKNDAGIYFPVHGTCQGFQVLCLLAAQNQSVLLENAFDSENMSLPLDFNPPGLAASRLFQSAPPDILAAFNSSNITLNLHHDGVPPDAFMSNSNLTGFFNLVSTNKDREGKPFVSTVEGINYPVTATQWHPERIQFEWKVGLGINHTLEAVRAMQHVGNFFVEESRRNNQSMTDPLLIGKYLLYNYVPSVLPGSPIEWGYQVYILDM